MATNFHFSTTTNLSPSQYLMLASLAMDDLKWKHRFTNENHIEAEQWLGNNTRKISVSVEGSEVVVDTKYDSWVLIGLNKNKKATEELLNQIQAKQAIYSPEELEAKYQQLKIESEAAIKDLEARMEAGNLTASEKMTLGIGGHKVTYSLIGLNILFFGIMIINGVGIFEPESADLIKWGANVRSYTEGGDWWRLGSAMFIHIGIIHLLLNMYALFSIGIYLEPVMGRWKFLAAYLSTGIVASLVSIWWHDNTASAGASGAIFGMYGVFLALLTTKFFDKNAQKSLLSSIGVFVFYNLVYGMKAGIDNAAHIGGLSSGLVFGYLFFLLQKSSWQKAYSLMCIAGAVAIAVIFLKAKQNDDISFYKAWEKISVLEEQAMQPLKNKNSLTSESFIAQSRNISLPAWQKAKQELGSVTNFKLTPKAAHIRNLLVEYVDLRIAFTSVIIEAEKSQNWDTANDIAKKIGDVLDEIATAQKG